MPSGPEDAPGAADRAEEAVRVAATSELAEVDDFIPLVIPPAPRNSWQVDGRRRVLAVIVIGLALLAALAVGAWFVLGNEADDNGVEALDRPNVPEWVAGGSPVAATPLQVGVVVATPVPEDVARDNTPSPTISPMDSLSVIGPGASGSPTLAVAPPTPSPIVLPSATPSPISTATAAPTTPPSRVTSPTLAPTAAPSPTATPTEPRVPATVYPNTEAGVLESLLADLEVSGADATPASSVPATPSPPAPIGDGTGGPPQTPPT